MQAPWVLPPPITRAKAGHEVTVFEAAPEPGGMAAHFDFGGLSIERFYHFVCKADRPTFELLDELGIGDLCAGARPRWATSSTADCIRGAIRSRLLRLPGLDLVSKLRYGTLMFVSTRRDRWDALEHMSARDWITQWCGTKAYDVLWRRLFDLKFYEYADNISAAWIWTRIKRVGRSRRSLLQEELGHIEGGSETLVKALVSAIDGHGRRYPACGEGRGGRDRGRAREGCARRRRSSMRPIQ